MKFGHHGANHPVQDIKTKEVYITSQNHGFAVDLDSLPKNILSTHEKVKSEIRKFIDSFDETTKKLDLLKIQKKKP